MVKKYIYHQGNLSMIREHTKPWFFIDSEFDSQPEPLSKEVIQHIKAKRLNIGQEIILFNSKYYQVLAKLITPEFAKIIDKKLIQKPKQSIELALPYCDPKLISCCLIKATELGASKIYLVHTEYSYSNASYKRIQDKHFIKWQKQIIEACQQAENIFIPKIIPDTKLTDLMEKNANKVVMGFEATPLCLEQHNTILFVGPEGGFSQKEAELFDQKVQCLHINSNILKIETAVTAGLTIISQLLTHNI